MSGRQAFNQNRNSLNKNEKSQTSLYKSSLCTDARSEDQISQCVRNGDRPTEDLIPADTPKEIILLMSNCWHEDPQSRPTFNGEKRKILNSQDLKCI